MIEEVDEISEFLEKYTLIENPYDSDERYEGNAFGLSKREISYVQEYAKKFPQRVWTIIEGDVDVEESEDLSVFAETIVNGFHLVNRTGFLITEEDGNPDESYNEISIF
jgi:hypothetical protein